MWGSSARVLTRVLPALTCVDYVPILFLERNMVEQLVINVGRRIRELREQRGLTLRQLSEKADVSPSTIQKIEKNLISPSLGTVLRIAKGLETTIESLLNAHPQSRDVVYLPKEKRGTIAVPDLKITLPSLAGGL